MVKPDHMAPIEGPLRTTTYNAMGRTLELIWQGLASADQSMAAMQRLGPRVMAHVLPQMNPAHKALHTGRVDRFLNAPLVEIIFCQGSADVGEALATVTRVVAEEADRWDATLERLQEEREN